MGGKDKMQGQKNCRIRVSGLPFNPSKLGEKADGHFPEKKTDRGHSQHQAGAPWWCPVPGHPWP